MKAVTREQKLEVLARLLQEWEARESYYGDGASLAETLGMPTNLTDTELIDSLYCEYIDYHFTENEDGPPEWTRFDADEEIAQERKIQFRRKYPSGQKLSKLIANTYGLDRVNEIHIERLIAEHNSSIGYEHGLNQCKKFVMGL